MTKTPQELFEHLDQLGITTSTVEHEAAFSVSEAQTIRGELEGGHTKNLFVKDKKQNYFLLVLEETAKIELNQLHKLIGAKSRLSFGNPERLMEYLGVLPGSVCAFAVLNDADNRVKLFIDAPLMRFEKINCHPLTNVMTTTILREDLIKFLNDVNHSPEIVQLSIDQ